MSSPKYAPVNKSNNHRYSDPTASILSTSSENPSSSQQPTKLNPFDRIAAEDYFEADKNVFYRPQRDIALCDVAQDPMGKFDWGLVPENFSDSDRKQFEMEELQAAAVLERHPCGPEMRALLNASRSLPVGVHQTVQSKMSGSRGNFKKALEVASQAGGAGGASHSLLYSKGGPERKINNAEMKWGPVKFSDMGTVALGEKITRDVIELRRAFSKRDAIVTFPDHVTPEALAFTASRFGPNWEMFDIQQHADPDSAIMKVYMNKNQSASSKKASLHGSESAMISYTKEGNPVWHRPSGDKALLSNAFRVADENDEPLIGPHGDANTAGQDDDDDNGGGKGLGISSDPNSYLAESNNQPLPPLPERPKGWPEDGPGHAPPSSQEGLRKKRFRLEDRVPAYKAVLNADKLKEATGPPEVHIGVKELQTLHKIDKEKKAKYRLPVWRALKSPGKKLDDDEEQYLKETGGGGGDFSEFEPDDARSPASQQRRIKSPTGYQTGDTPTGAQRSAPRSNREITGPLSPSRIRNTVMTPEPKPEEGVYNLPLQLRAARITEDNQEKLAAVEKKRDRRGRVIEDEKTKEKEEQKIGVTSAANSKALAQLLAPPSVPFSEVRRSHFGPMLPFMAVSGVPKFDAVTATEDQSTAWKELLEEI